jgi:transposase
MLAAPLCEGRATPWYSEPAHEFGLSIRTSIADCRPHTGSTQGRLDVQGMLHRVWPRDLVALQGVVYHRYRRGPRSLEDLSMRIVHPICAGMDVHKNSVSVCLVVNTPDGERRQELRRFGTMTRDLLALSDWLKEHGCRIVAMESTGVYWKPIFNILEAEFEVMLVNPTHFKNVPGRKTDAKDSEWLAELLEHGLLKASFVPAQEIRDLREVTRYRRRLVQTRTSEIQRVQKTLEGCNIKLASVATDLRGVSARSILEALLSGKKTPKEMAELTKGRLRQKRGQMEAALEGTIRPHQAWLIAQIVEHLDVLEENIAECDTKVEEMCRPFQEQLKLLDTVPGVNERAAQDIIAEVGVEMTPFKDQKHLCSWAALCPGNHESAGKRKSGRTRKGNQWLRTALVQCAHAAAHTKQTYLSSLYRRFTRKGVNKASIVVAHSILEAIYFILRDGVPYQELGAEHFEESHKERAIYHHLKRLKALGVDLFAEQVLPGHTLPEQMLTKLQFVPSLGPV